MPTTNDDDASRSAVARMVRPRSVAIVGMSSKPGSSGRTLLAQLESNDYAGEIHLVGRSGGEIDGRRVLTAVDELPLGVDVALLAVPAGGVRESVVACVRRQVGVAVIYASGFAEFGDEGRSEQAEITRLAREGGLHLVGPNCIGYTNYVDPLTTVFLPDTPVRPLEERDGRAFAVLAQSGALMGAIYRALETRGVPVSYRFSTGNEAGLNLADYLDFLAADQDTGGLVIYAEDIRDPRRFLAAVSRVREQGKTIVMMHTGRSAPAKEAAASHTGALAADYEVIKTLSEHAGACVVESLEELVDVSELLARYPTPPTAGLGLATTSGAFCAIAFDALDALDVDVPTLSPATKAVLEARLPSYMKAANPLDLGTAVAADRALLTDGAAALLGDEGIGSLTLAIAYAGGERSMETVRHVMKAVEGQSKPVALSFFGDGQAVPEEMRSYATQHGMIVSLSPERALRAAATLTRYGRQLNRARVPAGSGHPATTLSAGAHPEWQSKQYLADAGVPVPQGSLATSVTEAVEVADKIGYPVVAKAQAATLLHKTEVGGIVLDIGGEQELGTAWSTLTERVGAAHGIELDGILVEAMAPKGLELVVGGKRHPTWGPVVLVGLGGILVEALGDVRLLPPDLALPEIINELGKLRSAALLGGFRGAEPIDVDAVAATVAAVGRFMIEHPEVTELDINPLLARPDGVTALDVLITSSGEPSSDDTGASR